MSDLIVRIAVCIRPKDFLNSIFSVDIFKVGQK